MEDFKMGDELETDDKEEQIIHELELKEQSHVQNKQTYRAEDGFVPHLGRTGYTYPGNGKTLPLGKRQLPR